MFENEMRNPPYVKLIQLKFTYLHFCEKREQRVGTPKELTESLLRNDGLLRYIHEVFESGYLATGERRRSGSRPRRRGARRRLQAKVV
jgi:hypothetical protein